MTLTMQPANTTKPSLTMEEALKQISMTAANIGNEAAFEPVLEDWLKFIGGRPGEIAIIDGGSKAPMHDIYWRMFKEGKIDKLQVIRPEHCENDREKCYYQEHMAGAFVANPYILFFKSDTLPYREGHENWLLEAMGYLDRDDTFAVGGSFNIPSKHHEAWPGWYFSDKCSLNFALMKRITYMKAMEEFAGEYISSGFRGRSPMGPNGGRYVMETAFERYMQNHKLFTLAKVEDPTWTVFHTNVQGKKLVEVRENYLARVDVDRFMNAQINNRVLGGCFYGQPQRPWVNFKWRVSETVIQPVRNLIKRFAGAKRNPV
jgi:hypothetical protein